VALVAEALSVVAVVVAVASVAVLARQAREFSRQTRLAEETARLEGLREAIQPINRLVEAFLERPDLRPFFYEGAPAPTDDADLAARVAALSELFADALEGALVAAETLAKVGAQADDVAAYVRFLVERSPSTRAISDERPDWWPRLHAFIRDWRAATRSEEGLA
jgi:hypothetical protein